MIYDGYYRRVRERRMGQAVALTPEQTLINAFAQEGAGDIIFGNHIANSNYTINGTLGEQLNDDFGSYGLTLIAAGTQRPVRVGASVADYYWNFTKTGNPNFTFFATAAAQAIAALGGQDIHMAAIYATGIENTGAICGLIDNLAASTRRGQIQIDADTIKGDFSTVGSPDTVIPRHATDKRLVVAGKLDCWRSTLNATRYSSTVQAYPGPKVAPVVQPSDAAVGSNFLTFGRGVGSQHLGRGRFVFFWKGVDSYIRRAALVAYALAKDSDIKLDDGKHHIYVTGDSQAAGQTLASPSTERVDVLRLATLGAGWSGSNNAISGMPGQYLLESLDRFFASGKIVSSNGKRTQLYYQAIGNDYLQLGQTDYAGILDQIFLRMDKVRAAGIDVCMPTHIPWSSVDPASHTFRQGADQYLRNAKAAGRIDFCPEFARAVEFGDVYNATYMNDSYHTKNTGEVIKDREWRLEVVNHPTLGAAYATAGWV